VDLGGLVEGGLATLDWASMGSAFRANDLGHIFGYGLLTDMPSGQINYVSDASIYGTGTGGRLVVWVWPSNGLIARGKTANKAS